MTKKFIVIGASAASMSFMAKLRSFDTESEIICFSGENYLPYNRCLLADFMTEEKTFADILLKPAQFFKEYAITLRLQTWITQINRQEKVVVCQNGHEESYDYLFVGTGTYPFVPPIQGNNLPGVFSFHAFADVDALDTFIHDERPKNVIVVGAGINGIEAAHALVERGLHVTIVDMFDQIMPLQVDSQAAAFIQEQMVKQGVVVVKGQRVVALETRQKKSVGRVVFESGACMPTDCVVFATGCRLNSKLVQDADLATQFGSLVVNDQMQTSDLFIYAGGDICRAKDMVTGDVVQSVTWSDAMLQGLTAATQLSDAPRKYPGIVGLRDSYFFGYEFYGCGQTTDVEMFDVVQVHTKDFLHKFYLFDGVLQGFILIGNVTNVGKYKTMYMTKQKIERSDLV